MDNHEESESLEICTDTKADWETFLGICEKVFHNSAAFQRSHPDPIKRKHFTKAYFNYLYETELSGGRAGLACLKRHGKNMDPEIVYGLVGIYAGSKKTAGNKHEMISIDKHGMEIALMEDEWVSHNIGNKMLEFANTHGCTCIAFSLQAAKYPDQGTATKYMMAAAEMIGWDGRKRGLLPAHLPVIGYGIVDDAKCRSVYKAVGMIEIAHLHTCKSSPFQYNCVDIIGEKKTAWCDCIFVMCKCYPERSSLEKEMKEIFSSASLSYRLKGNNEMIP